MTTSIPASAFVAVNPSVLSAGGNAVNLNGLFLTDGTRVPIGSVLQFASASNVSSYFGASSIEAAYGSVYFQGFTNSTQKPGALLFAQYNTADTAAYLRGGSISGLTTTQIQSIPAGTMKISVNGVVKTSGSINLSAASSLSAAATTIGTAFSTFVGDVTYDSVSGGMLFTTTATGASETIGYITSSSATASACTTTGTILTIGGSVTGTFKIGDNVTGTDTTNSLPVGCTIVNQLTGSAGLAGTYTISAAATPGNMASAAVIAYSATGALAQTLALTSATGAILSQGAAAATPAAFMTNLIDQTTNWATFTTTFDPDSGSGNTQKLAFAAWVTLQNNRYMYVPMDTDITPTESTDAASSLGQILIGNGNSGTAPIYEPSDLYQTPYLCGAVASINYSQRNGNASMAFKSQAGITPGVFNQTVMTNLIANGYNSYVSVANANNQWQYFYPGSVTGTFKSIQRYVNQIWLNAGLQTALVTLLTTVPAVAYAPTGYTLIASACQTPIDSAINFGMIQKGVTLSPAQIAEVNSQAGVDIASTLQTRGWYLQVLDPGAVVRGQGGSPAINFWYTDGGSVLQINLASIDVQ